MATDSPPPLSPPSRPSSALSMRSEDTDFTNQTESSENSDINADDPPPRRIRSKIYKREGKCCILCGTPGDEVAGGVIRLAEWRNNSVRRPCAFVRARADQTEARALQLSVAAGPRAQGLESRRPRQSHLRSVASLLAPLES